MISQGNFLEPTVELLSIDSYLSHPTRSDQFDRQLESQGEFKISRPARPQYCLLRPGGRQWLGASRRASPLCWRAEHAVEYMSSTQGRESRWRTFSTFPQWKLV